MDSTQAEAVRIPLKGKGGEGRFALVDACDAEKVAGYNWRLHGHGYAVATLPREGGPGRVVLMHRLILDTPAGHDTDHINLDKLDNRRSNLRICTRSENLRNRAKYRGSSRFKGVSWDAKNGKWAAFITLNGKATNLGRFSTEEAAAHAYDEAARTRGGPYARTNF